MSQYKSPFIAGSADPQYSARVNAHFNLDANKDKSSTVGGYKQKYGSKDVMTEFLNSESGVNYSHNGAKGNNPRG